ncbi:hypothetical protein N658DRAFT_499847 [Parathielavia hyrcaniae]|uniref:Uncharacterized protein n=1 Tax=Parathielavia hyrcaniae TaxID=113614 RepID=A0AAN6PWL7_9PEZI|nr:hypothetical protein N658DRAFT_499847 [Parathielavia hyrcaniae]
MPLVSNRMPQRDGGKFLIGLLECSSSVRNRELGRGPSGVQRETGTSFHFYFSFFLGFLGFSAFFLFPFQWC